jgi:cobalt-zinc-cadmium resistance protein CzcA
VLIVFSPLLTLQGLEGQTVQTRGIDHRVCHARGAALRPDRRALARGLLLRERTGRLPALRARLQEAYATTLRGRPARPALPGPRRGFCCSSARCSPQVGRTFMPVMDEGDIIVQLEKSPSISLGASVDIDRADRDSLLLAARAGDPPGGRPHGLRRARSRSHGPQRDGHLHAARTLATSGGPGARPRWSRRSATVLSDFPGMSYGFTQPIQMRVSEMLTGSTATSRSRFSAMIWTTLGHADFVLPELVAAVRGPWMCRRRWPESDGFLNLRLRQDSWPRGQNAGRGLRRVPAQPVRGPASAIIEGRKRIPIALVAGRDAVGRQARKQRWPSQTPVLLPGG